MRRRRRTTTTVSQGINLPVTCIPVVAMEYVLVDRVDHSHYLR
jgi:hypothetical protein